MHRDVHRHVNLYSHIYIYTSSMQIRRTVPIVHVVLTIRIWRDIDRKGVFHTSTTLATWQWTSNECISIGGQTITTKIHMSLSLSIYIYIFTHPPTHSLTHSLTPKCKPNFLKAHFHNDVLSLSLSLYIYIYISHINKSIYIYIYRRLGGLVQPGNRFASFVRARGCM